VAIQGAVPLDGHAPSGLAMTGNIWDHRFLVDEDKNEASKWPRCGFQPASTVQPNSAAEASSQRQRLPAKLR